MDAEAPHWDRELGRELTQAAAADDGRGIPAGFKSLWDLAPNGICTVHGFHGEMDEKYRVRLMELGFHPGETVTCIQTPVLGAPRLFRVHNTIYALDDQVARQVMITEPLP